MFLGKYNQAKTVRFRLFQVDGVDFEPAATFAVGDIKIMKDEGVEANTTNLPTDEGQGYSLVLTAAEMSAARIEVYIVDQTATKVWLDTGISVETYGHPSAEHAFDLDTASTAQTADHTAGIAAVQATSDDIQTQVGNLSSGSAAISTVAASASVTTGTETLTYAASSQLDGSLHEVAPVGSSTEFYYEFSVGGNGVPVEFVWDGYAQSNGDSYTVKAYNWVGASWDQIGSINAANGTAIVSNVFLATNSHVGTGSDIGKVRLQFTSADGTNFATDRVLCSYAVVSESVGYALGRVWINTDAANTGTTNFVDGVADNPVSTLAAAKTIADNLGIKDFHVTSNSTITLASALNGYNMFGIGYALDFNGQDVGGTHFYHSSPTTGTALAATGHVDFLDSIINTMTVNESHFANCSFTESTLTLGAVAGDVRVIDCRSVVAGAGTPTIDFGTSAGIDHNLTIANWQNGIQIENFNANVTVEDKMSMSGTGQLIIAASCTGGTINLRGQWRVTDNSGGAVTIVRDAVAQGVIDVEVDTGEIGVAGAGLTDLGGMSTGMKAEVNAEADTALTDYAGPTNAQMEARTPTAAQLAYIVANSATGMPATFTTAGGSTTTAVLNLVDGAAGSATDDQYNGRLLVFTDGTLKGCVTDITDYVGATTTATITAIPFAPTSSHNARLI